MNRKALSLVEILVSAFILIFAMLPLWGLMSTSHEETTKSADELKACQLVAEVMDQIEYRCTKDEIVALNEEEMETGKEIIPGKVKFGDISEFSYLKPVLTIKPIATNEKIAACGCIVEVFFTYKNKKGQEETYWLRGFVSEN